MIVPIAVIVAILAFGSVMAGGLELATHGEAPVGLLFAGIGLVGMVTVGCVLMWR